MWNKLYNAALKVQNGRTISPFIDAGGVAAAILTKQGNIYVGVCIDTASTLGMCAERNAIFQAHLLGYKPSDYAQLCIVADSNEVTTPCGSCRQVLAELYDKDAPIYCSNLEGKYIKTTINELLPYGFSEGNLKK